MAVRLNEDKELVAQIREGLKRKGGYCPCRVEKNRGLQVYLQRIPGADGGSGF